MQHLSWYGKSPNEKVRLYTTYELSIFIDNCIFSERDRAILKRRLLDGVKFDDLAEEFKYSSRHIKRIFYRAENKLIKYIEHP